jgi:hypothetical protein
MPEEQRLDVLENIEFAIVSVYCHDQSILDQDARDATAALVRHYEAEQESRGLGAHHLTERAERIFQAVVPICEWRLGRAPGPDGSAAGPAARKMDDIIYCLRKIRKSVDFWTKEGGRQGYLKFVENYVPR